MSNRFILALTALVTALGAAAPSAQSPTLKSVMRAKAEDAEQLLRPLIAADFVALERSVERLSRLTYTEVGSWQARPDAAYLHQARLLVRGLQTLREGARGRNIDKAADGYTAVVSACVGCHKQASVVRMTETAGR
jgi:hypothetical protein